MKVVIITVPARGSHRVHPVIYTSCDNKALEYGKPVRCCINGLLARTLKEKDEEVKVIYVLVGGDSDSTQNKNNFIQELNEINREIGVRFNFEIITTTFDPIKKDLNKFINDLLKKIPENSDIYADITYGYKPISISLIPVFMLAEKIRNANIKYIVYGGAEFDERGNIIESKLFDITLYYSFIKLLGIMEEDINEETASIYLKKFFDY